MSGVLGIELKIHNVKFKNLEHLPWTVKGNEVEIQDESDDIKSEMLEIFINSNIIEDWTRVDVLQRLKLSSHTDTLTEASNLKSDLNKKGEIENEL